MKSLLVVAAALALVGPAKANLVLSGGTPTNSFVDLGAEGFGAAPRMLTLQTHPIETGGVTPVDVVNGDAVAGANKSTTPTLAALGWSTGANVGIGFNSDQTGAVVNSGITVNSLDLKIYNGTTQVGPTFSLAAPFTFSEADLALQQGNGNAIFDYVLTPAEQAQFNTIVAMAGSSNFFAGLSSSLGCTGTVSPTCQPATDGPDTYLGFNQASVVPAPLIGHGLLALLAIGGVLFGSRFLERAKGMRTV